MATRNGHVPNGSGISQQVSSSVQVQCNQVASALLVHLLFEHVASLAL